MVKKYPYLGTNLRASVLVLLVETNKGFILKHPSMKSCTYHRIVEADFTTYDLKRDGNLWIETNDNGYPKIKKYIGGSRHYKGNTVLFIDRKEGVVLIGPKRGFYSNGWIECTNIHYWEDFSWT